MQFYGFTEIMENDLLLRRERVAALLAEQGADAAIVSTNANLFYLTGRVPDGYFYMTAQGLCVMFLRRPHAWEGRSIVRIKHPGEIPSYLERLDLPSPRRISLEDELPHSEYARLAAVFPSAVALPSVIRRARMVKTPLEIEILRDTGALHAKAQQGVAELFRAGMTDKEFEIEIDHHFRTMGHPGTFRIAGHRMEAAMSSVLAGDNAQAPSPFDFALGGAGTNYLPFAANGTELEEGTTVMVDASGYFAGYMTDLSRTYAIGEIPHVARAMHEAALEIQAAFVASAQVGTRCCDLYNQALDIARRKGFEENFMGLTQRAKFVGHGVGIEVNESPVIAPKDTTPLEEGMVLAVEPKFVVPGVGPVGIENTFVITENGPERITPGDDAIQTLE